MIIKDYSLSKKEGWNHYKETSWILLFKFGGSTGLSLVIYGGLILISGFCIHNNGIESSVTKYIR